MLRLIYTHSGLTVITITDTALSGGQGKSTVSLFLAKYLARSGYRTLVIDADPQANLTMWSGFRVQGSDPTLLEVLRMEVKPADAIYKLDWENLWLIPADRALEKAHDYLASTGIGALALRTRLKSLAKLFDFCVIDSPPARSQVCITAVGAADQVLIPAEANAKGVSSVLSTLGLVNELTQAGACDAEVLGIVPFRDRWFGNNQSLEGRSALDLIRKKAPGITILPSIHDSQLYVKAISAGKMPNDFLAPQDAKADEEGKKDLEYPFKTMLSQLEKS